MKTKGLFVALIALTCSLTANAEEAEINGLWYELVSRAKEAKVIQYKNDIKYSGDVVIPETVDYKGAEYSVKSIGDDAFLECSSLTSVTIPGSVTSIGSNAFQSCSSLTSVHISDLAAWCKISFADFYSNPLPYAHHLYLNNQEIIDLVIPNSVTSIGRNLFYGCSGLTSVTIPNSVTSIGYSAFYECSSLTSVTIPGSVTSIGRNAFQSCSSLTSVTIPNSVTSIEGGAFFGCSGLTSVTIPNSVTSIGGEAFYECSSLTSVTIPNSVTSIGSNAFQSCSSLTSVTIPNSVTSIGEWTFYECSSLTSVTIPNSVTSIEGGAFYGCSGLTSVTIPNSVTSIGESAFNGCSGLTSVTIGSGTQKIGSKAFAKCSELADVYCNAEEVPSMINYWGDPVIDAFEDSYSNFSTLHVPASTIDRYRTTAPWSEFGTIVTLSGDMPVLEQCAKPTIHYQNGKLSFKCATDGVGFVSEITDADIKKNYAAEVDLSVTYHVSVYATKAGYTDSEIATATLCWIDEEPQKVGITEGDEIAVAVTQVMTMPVLIQSEGNVLMVSGAKAGTAISVHDLSGKMLGQATAVEGMTRVECSGGLEKVVIVKVGERSVKVMR